MAKKSNLYLYLSWKPEDCFFFYIYHNIFYLYLRKVTYIVKQKKWPRFKKSQMANSTNYLKSKHHNTKKWNDLEIGKIYIVKDTGVVTTQKGESMVLTLKNNGAVWAPGHLKKRVIEQNICPPFYIRPQGLKPCKNNPANKYYAYDLVVKK